MSFNFCNVRRTPKTTPPHAQRGVAILLVVFLVTLATIIVTSLARSTFFSSRYQLINRQRVESEFLLKSALNFARALIASDHGESDPPHDKLLGMFSQGQSLPLSSLGINIPGTVITLEIRAEDGKLPIRYLKDSGLGSGPAHQLFIKWRGVFARFFQIIGCDQDGEKMNKGPFKGRTFNSEEMVANLIDYMDADTESYSGEGGFASGIEGQLGEEKFPNREPERLNDLLSIPGFTENRLRKMASHVMLLARSSVNVNYASTLALRALDSQLSEEQARAIVNRVNSEGPFNKDSFDNSLSSMMPSFDELRGSLLGYRTSYFQTIVKLQFGDSRYFLRAFVAKSRSGEEGLPALLGYELIG